MVVDHCQPSRLHSDRQTPNVVHYEDRYRWIIDQLKSKYVLGVLDTEQQLVQDFYFVTNATQKDLSSITLQYDLSYLYHIGKLDRTFVAARSTYLYSTRSSNN